MRSDRLLVEETYNLMKNQPTLTLEQAKNEVLKGYTSIPFVYKYAVVVLGILALLTAVAGIIVLIIDPDGTRMIPESLVAIGSASVGALVGIFAPVPSNDRSADV